MRLMNKIKEPVFSRLLYSIVVYALAARFMSRKPINTVQT